MTKYVFGILVANRFGVLTRVSSMFTRRGFNIDTLTVGETQSPEFSRITISMMGDEYSKTQIIKQLGKLHDVKQVEVMERDETVTRELLLIKIKNDSATRQDVLSAVDVFRSKIVDYSPDALCIEITGESSKINAFIELVKEQVKKKTILNEDYQSLRAQAIANNLRGLNHFDGLANDLLRSHFENFDYMDSLNRIQKMSLDKVLSNLDDLDFSNVCVTKILPNDSI